MTGLIKNSKTAMFILSSTNVQICTETVPKRLVRGRHLIPPITTLAQRHISTPPTPSIPKPLPYTSSVVPPLYVIFVLAVPPICHPPPFYTGCCRPRMSLSFSSFQYLLLSWLFSIMDLWIFFFKYSCRQ